ncbi:MAG: sigma-54-dependent Fis family transcriptional regulator [Desulfamplus sp.]|nr:sigma-54-dependent Fis family transcriptional regulator [Desulfamplus sp.]
MKNKVAQEYHPLEKRVRELTCLYGIANLLENQGVSLSWIMERAAELIPSAWRFPENVCARIHMEGKVHASGNFMETPWCRRADIILNDEPVGRVEIYHIKPGLDMPIEEESRVVKAISERLSKVVWLKRYEEAIREEKRTLKQTAHLLDNENRVLRSSLGERYRLGDIFGRSSEMQKVYEVILKAAVTDAGVAIFGESGSGKELAARAIHDHSSRKGMAFVAVNCGAIQDTLFEREFFGHRKGAFSGAHAHSRGYLDMAHKGTLFLDEVAELTVNMQAKLLRAIESGEYRPVGQTEPLLSDFRVISASNTPLTHKVAQGSMRSDFFYRIQVIQMELPPLCRRKEDIPLLVEHLLGKMTKNSDIPRIPGNIMDALTEYDWPGNVRELRNVLQRYLTLGELALTSSPAGGNISAVKERPAGGNISAVKERPARGNIPPGGIFNLRELELPSQENLSLHELKSVSPGEKNFNLREHVQETERSLIKKALEHTNGNRTRAAELLGISRRALFRKISTL